MAKRRTKAKIAADEAAEQQQGAEPASTETAVKEGDAVNFFYMVGGPKVIACKGEVVAVHEGGLLDLEVQLKGARVPSLRRAVPMHAGNRVRASTWAPRT